MQAGFGGSQLSDHAGFEAHRRFALDRRSEKLHRIFQAGPSSSGKGYPVTGILNQQWREWTGRFNATWTPTLDFTDQSLFYGSYSRGYKGGGANPPGVIPFTFESPSNETHPLTFKPEFVDAFELGTKNTLLDGAMTLNGDVFYYKYQNYRRSPRLSIAHPSI